MYLMNTWTNDTQLVQSKASLFSYNVVIQQVFTVKIICLHLKGALRVLGTERRSTFREKTDYRPGANILKAWRFTREGRRGERYSVGSRRDSKSFIVGIREKGEDSSEHSPLYQKMTQTLILLLLQFQDTKAYNTQVDAESRKRQL